jgi:hypothetical protein
MNSNNYNTDEPPKKPELRPIPETERDIPQKSRFIIRKKRNMREHGMLRNYVIDMRKQLKKEEDARILAQKIKQEREYFLQTNKVQTPSITCVCNAYLRVLCVFFHFNGIERRECTVD